MSGFNFDMSAAPRGKTVKVTRKVKTVDGVVEREIDEFIHERVIIANKDGQVLASRWLPPTKFVPNGRWDGFSENSDSPVAWMAWPEHPSAGKEIESGANAAANSPAPEVSAAATRTGNPTEIGHD